jgi:hypothetical protein
MWPGKKCNTLYLVVTGYYSVELMTYIVLWRVLVGKPEARRPLGEPMRRWEDSIKMNLRDVGRGGGGWIGSIWLRIGPDCRLL